MNQLRKYSKVIALCLAICTILTGVTLPQDIFAKTAQEKKEEAQQQLQDINGQLNNLKDSQDDIKKKISLTKDKLNALFALQDALDAEIKTTNAALATTQKELDAANAEVDKQYEAMKIRIQYMYENSSEDSIWEALIKAEGLADLLNRVEYVSQIHKTDRELMEQYQAAVDTVIAKQDLLVEQMDELLMKEEVFLAQQSEIEETLAGLNADKKEFDKLLATAQQKATALKAEISRQEQIIEEERRRAEEERKRKEEEEKKKLEEALRENTKGAEIVKYALQFVGNPYVWGGNSLTKGCDCSGFVHLIYKHFGFNTVRYSLSFANEGKKVDCVKGGKADISKMQPGDIVVYSKVDGIGHVAIYIGNGKIVEAQSSKAGITSNRDVNCRRIIAVRRMVNN